MSGDYKFGAKIVSPVKCNEKPWDLWVSEIGRLSPRRDDDGTFAVPAEIKSGVSARRSLDHHPYKAGERARHRRAGIHRLPRESMSLHSVFPQLDNLNAAVCHMCGVIVKCSAAYRHLVDSHTSTELLPPPAPVATLRTRSRHKKEPPPSVSIEVHPVKMETSPIHTATAPLSRIVLPQPDLQYLEEASTSAVTAEVQVCMESGELPVVSIQDTDDLPLGDNLTDDIFDIMNSEGIQSADDITNPTDWKNIIKDIGNMQDISFSTTADTLQSTDIYAPMNTALPTYTLTEADLSSITFAPNLSPMVTSVMDQSVHTPAPVVKPAATPSTPSTRSSRSKTGKTKFNQREYDPNKHCGVVTGENQKPCTRSLTCKAHALSLRRSVDGRAKPFDTLLAEHRAARDAAAAAAAVSASSASIHAHPTATAVAAAPAHKVPPLLVNNTTLDLSVFNGLTTEQQVNDIYATLLEEGEAVLPDTSTITSLLNQQLTADGFLLPDDAEVPLLNVTSPLPHLPPPLPDEPPPGLPSLPTLVPADICWYNSLPRPLALCTFNASHAGSAITLSKKFATVRSNIKSSLTRSQCKSSGTSGTNDYYYNQNALSMSKSVHMNASKSMKPEVRKLIVTCASSRVSGDDKDVRHTLSELFAGEVRSHTLNGHAHAPERKRSSLKHGKRSASAVLDLGFSMDSSLLADEKC